MKMFESPYMVSKREIKQFGLVGAFVWGEIINPATQYELHKDRVCRRQKKNIYEELDFFSQQEIDVALEKISKKDFPGIEIVLSSEEVLVMKREEQT